MNGREFIKSVWLLPIRHQCNPSEQMQELWLSEKRALDSPYLQKVFYFRWGWSQQYQNHTGLNYKTTKKDTRQWNQKGTIRRIGIITLINERGVRRHNVETILLEIGRVVEECWLCNCLGTGVLEVTHGGQHYIDCVEVEGHAGPVGDVGEKPQAIGRQARYWSY